MTRAAWLMLAGTWGVVVFCAARLFWLVLRTPLGDDDATASGEPSPEGDSRNGG